jgi:hypothetical protein
MSQAVALDSRSHWIGLNGASEFKQNGASNGNHEITKENVDEGQEKMKVQMRSITSLIDVNHKETKAMLEVCPERPGIKGNRN